MASTNKSLTARAAVGIGAVAVAALTVVGGAMPAAAAPSFTAPDGGGSITIHKFEEPAVASGLAHDGTEVNTAGLTPMRDIAFDVTLVPGIDLMTDAGWTQAAALDVAAAQAQIGAAAATRSGTTNAAGALPIDGLDIGVYLVEETTPAGTNGIVMPAAPFLVSIPLPVDNQWLFDVHVYPKNSVTSIVKSVDPGAVHVLGQTVPWRIAVEVPEIAAGSSLTSFVITDQLDSRLSLQSVTIAGTNVSLGAADYSVTPQAPSAAGALVTITFTAAGLDKLEVANMATVTVTLNTRVESLDGSGGTIANRALVNINGTTFTSNPSETKWGSLSILKHAADDAQIVLQGAVFRVYQVDPTGVMPRPPHVVEVQSEADGIAFVPILAPGVYWIEEITPPAGYMLSANPIQQVTVVAGELSRTGIDVSVPNPQRPPYALPVTGGSGEAAFILGGLGLLTVAVGFALFRRRKAETDA